MSLTRMTQSERETNERRSKEVEEAAEREYERTIADAKEHRDAVGGDAAGPNGQMVSARHEGGVTNSFGAPIDPKTGELKQLSSTGPKAARKPEGAPEK